LIWASSISVMPFVEQGKARALAVSTQQRSRLLPQVPTVAESALPGFDIDIFYGVTAPAKVAPHIVARLGESIRQIIDVPDGQKRMSTLGLSPEFRNSEQFRELFVREHLKYGTVIREAGIQPA
jgi:tripartite-type tricarboxylate transporter receptor subunit TctC